MATTQFLVDYSIEYCHIYTNEDISGEHIASVEALKAVVGDLRNQGVTYNLCVMVDDYSFPETSLSFDYGRLFRWLAGQQAPPHFLIREGSLAAAADEVVRAIYSQKRQRALRSYIERKRYPCSLLTAAWYLARLGKLQTVPEPKILHARRLINILPGRFEPYECEARAILADTPYADVLHSITNSYVDLRVKR
jgi:hypothetical protein